MAKMKGVSCVTRKGAQYWYAYLDGKKTYCGKGNKGKKIAEASKGKNIARKYENMGVNAGLEIKKSNFKNVGEMCDWYYKNKANWRKKSFDRQARAGVHIRKYFGHMHINQVQGDEQEEYRLFREQQKVTSGSIDYEIAILSIIYHFALKRGHIQHSDMPREFVRLREKNPRRRITDEEYQKIIEVSEPDFRDFITAGFETAMRISEIINLLANKVKLDVQHISGKRVDYIDLGIFDTKNKTRRTVPVSGKLKEILKKRMKGLGPDDHVFTKDGILWKEGKVRKDLKAACEEIDIPYGDKLLNKKGERVGIVFHSLRHTRTSKWVEMGFSDEIIRRATGHKNLDAYRDYIHLDPSIVMRLVETEDKLDKIGTKNAESLIP